MVKARLLLSTDAVHPGGTAHVVVWVRIAAGYHINDHHPSLDYLIPTELTLNPGKAFAVQNITYPKGSPEKFAFSNTRLAVYEGEIDIGAVLKVDRNVAPREYPLQGRLKYQACNDHACFPPAAVPLALKVKVARSTVPLHRINSSVFGHAS